MEQCLDRWIRAGKVVLIGWVVVAVSSCDTMDFYAAIHREQARQDDADNKAKGSSGQLYDEYGLPVSTLIPIPEDPPYTIRSNFN